MWGDNIFLVGMGGPALVTGSHGHVFLFPYISPSGSIPLFAGMCDRVSLHPGSPRRLERRLRCFHMICLVTLFEPVASVGPESVPLAVCLSACIGVPLAVWFDVLASAPVLSDVLCLWRCYCLAVCRRLGLVRGGRGGPGPPRTAGLGCS